MKVAYVDIDDTICTSPKLDGKNLYEQAAPILENIRKINNLYDSGYYIVYWTARGNTTKINWEQLTLQQLNEWGAKYHRLEINSMASLMFTINKLSGI